MRIAVLLIFTTVNLASPFVFSQNEGLRILSGKVVEMTNGKATGVSGLLISIQGFDDDVTTADGSFSLNIPPGRDHVTIVLENSPLRMIAPMEGLVNLPPASDMQVIICGEQNRKLLQEVDRLNARVAKLKKENELTNRQIAALRQTMLDTILVFQQQVQELEDETAELNLQLDEKNRRIRELEASQQRLMQELEDALQAKYLRQKAEFDRVSAELQEYLSRLKDLQLRCSPHKLTEYFRNPAAVSDLSGAKEAYNAAWQAITINHQNRVLAVQKNWENPLAAETLETTYRYLLNDVHQKQVLPLDERVFGPLAAYLSKQTGRMKAEREAKNEAELLAPALTRSIQELERQIQQALDAMKKNI